MWPITSLRVSKNENNLTFINFVQSNIILALTKFGSTADDFDHF
jgi:hypothetical protein